MVGIPDYDTYVQHRQANHPGLPLMTYEDLRRTAERALRDRQGAFPRLLLSGASGA